MAVLMTERPPGTPPPTTEAAPTMRLLYCQKCRNPIARVQLRPGSVVEIKCHRCGIKTTEVR